MIRNVAPYLAFPVVSNDLSGLSRTDIICDGRGVLSFLRISSAITSTSMSMSMSMDPSLGLCHSFVIRHSCFVIFTPLAHHFSPVTFFFPLLPA
jgi:hypothetical protein